MRFSLALAIGLLVPAGCGSDSAVSNDTDSGSTTDATSGGTETDGTPAEEEIPIEEGIYWIGCIPGTEDDDWVPEGQELATCRDTDREGHRVYLDAFYIDRTEVSRAAYQECVVEGACTEPELPENHCGLQLPSGQDACFDVFWTHEKSNRPVTGVSHAMAAQYCAFRGKRLPTEAEWEAAARGNDPTAILPDPPARYYPWGNELGDDWCTRAWFAKRYDDDLCGDKPIPLTRPVDSFPDGATPEGVLQLAGNVAEWVSDRYSVSTFAVAAAKGGAMNPAGGENLARWSVKGPTIRLANRTWGPLDAAVSPALRDSSPWRRWDLGFRCARSAGGKQPKCGNKIVEVGELCDDGNLYPADGCTPTCEPSGVERWHAYMRGVPMTPDADDLALQPLDVVRAPGPPMFVVLGRRAGSQNFVMRFDPDALRPEMESSQLALYEFPAAAQGWSPTAVAASVAGDVAIVGTDLVAKRAMAQVYSGDPGAYLDDPLRWQAPPIATDFGSTGAAAVFVGDELVVIGSVITELDGPRQVWVARYDATGAEVYSQPWTPDAMYDASATAVVLSGDELVMTGYGGGTASRQAIVQRFDAATGAPIGTTFELPATPADGNPPKSTEAGIAIVTDAKPSPNYFVIASVNDPTITYALAGLDADLNPIAPITNAELANYPTPTAQDLLYSNDRLIVAGTLTDGGFVAAHADTLGPALWERRLEPGERAGHLARGKSGGPLYVGTSTQPVTAGDTGQPLRLKVAELIE